MVMGKIYVISKKIHEVTGIQVTSVFLVLNCMVWAVVAWILGCIGCNIFAYSLANQHVTLACIVGYTMIIIGFFGGILYLYRQD